MVTEKMLSDFRYFKKNYDAFYKKYGHSFIVIKNEEVIGVYKTFEQAKDETVKKEKPGTFCIQECTGDESGYTSYIASYNVCAI